MLRLNTFGCLNLVSAARPLEGSALHPKRLALLALVASDGGRGVTREKVIGLLWSELPEERARHALAQALYALKRDLGVSDAILGSTELRLNPAILASDVAEFGLAIASRNWEDAVGLYAGSFLDGVYIEDANEFGRWVEEQRARLAHDCVHALEQLCDSPQAAAQPRAHLGWLRRWSALEPLNTAVAVRLVRATAASGDHGGAVRLAAAHEQLLHDELGIAAPAELRAAIAEVRSDLARAPSATMVEGAEPFASDLPSTVIGAARPAPFRRKAVFRLLAGGVATSLAVVGGVWASGRTQAATDGTHRVAILPFDVSGAAALGFMGPGIVDLVSGVIDGAGGIRSLDPRVVMYAATQASDSVSNPRVARSIAGQLRADYYAVGSIIGIDANVRITATVYDVDSAGAPLTQSSAECPRDNLARCVNQLSGDVIRAIAGPGAVRFAREAANETTSFEALRAYLEGEAALRRANFAAAVEAFLRATRADTLFAIAHYRLAIAADWADRSDLVPGATATAHRLADKLSERERLLLEAMTAWRTGNADRAEQLYRHVLHSHPDDIEGWNQLGEVLFHDNPLRGRSIAEARPAFERVLQLDPQSLEARKHLVRVAAVARDTVAVDTLARSLLAAEARPGSIDLRALRAYIAGGEADRERFLEDFSNAATDDVYTAVTRLAIYGGSLDGAAEIAGILTAPGRVADDRAVGHLMRAYLAAATGAFRRSELELSAGAALWPQQAALTRAELFVPTSRLASDAQIRAAAVELDNWQAGPPRGVGRYRMRAPPDYLRRWYLRALLALRIQDPATFAKQLQALRAQFSPLSDTVAFESSLAAHAAAAAGEHAKALTRLRPNSAFVFDRWLRAELLRGSGNLREALTWYGSFEESAFESLPFVAPAHVRRGEILEELGDRRAAALEYRRAIELFRDADASDPWVVRARHRLNALAN